MGSQSADKNEKRDSIFLVETKDTYEQRYTVRFDKIFGTSEGMAFF